jgi:predicted metal-dependent hydrolase
MRVRQPKFDFSQSPAVWSAVPEFAHSQNAASVGIPPLERFLNRVMAKARKEIVGDDPASVALRADITTFIRQESCHYAVHDQMNAILVRDGYDRIPEFEQEIEAHYNRLFETKSLAFLVAYCEGFETLGPASAIAWCGDSLNNYLVGADPNIEMMYRWHLMEEFEHRHVCFDTFKRLHGGYFMRIYGFLYQLICFRKYASSVRNYLLEKDRAGMTAQQVKESKQREKAVSRALMKDVIWNLVKVFSPTYRPHNLPIPTRWRQIEDEIDTNWIPARSSASVAAATA